MKSLVNTLVPFFLVFALITVLTGCDTESVDENNVIITPQSVNISKGQAVTFTASGGYEYRWTLDGDGATADEWGSLSTTRGNTTAYTSLQNSTTNNVTVRPLTVTSIIVGSGNSSNETSYSQSSTVYITHIQ